MYEKKLAIQAIIRNIKRTFDSFLFNKGTISVGKSSNNAASDAENELVGSDGSVCECSDKYMVMVVELSIVL